MYFRIQRRFEVSVSISHYYILDLFLYFMYIPSQVTMSGSEDEKAMNKESGGSGEESEDEYVVSGSFALLPVSLFCRGFAPILLSEVV